jgi:hypothetical protein
MGSGAKGNNLHQQRLRSLILIITTQHHRYTHASLRPEREVEVEIISYGELERRPPRQPPATYIFTDVDRLHPSMAMQAATHYRKLRRQGEKVLNDPARVLSRFGLLRALNRAGINDFDAYRVEDLEQPRRWPVFLRVDGSHGEPASGLLHSRAELEAAIATSIENGLPRSLLLIIEYAAEPVRPGVFRKLSVFRLGDRLLGYTCVHDNQWIVKYGRAAVAPLELYEEEYEFVAGNPFAEVMRPVFEIAGVEYGRVDFGLVGGRPQIYEINTNPDIKLRPEPSPIARRNESNDLFKANYLAAMAAIDTPGTSTETEQAKTNAL